MLKLNFACNGSMHYLMWLVYKVNAVILECAASLHMHVVVTKVLCTFVLMPLVCLVLGAAWEVAGTLPSQKGT